MGGASDLFGGVQVISQLRSNQNIRYRGKKKTIQDYFNITNKGINCTIRLRGGEEVNATVSSARLKVDAHSGKKRFVIALKYLKSLEFKAIMPPKIWRAMQSFCSLT
jgi:hypothetical protein